MKRLVGARSTRAFVWVMSQGVEALLFASAMGSVHLRLQKDRVSYALSRTVRLLSAAMSRGNAPSIQPGARAPGAISLLMFCVR